jgi:hypothetical protein
VVGALPASRACLLFDMAGSMERLVALGGRSWLALQAQYSALVRQELARHGGEEINMVGPAPRHL